MLLLFLGHSLAQEAPGPCLDECPARILEVGTQSPVPGLVVVLDGKEANKSDKEGVFRFDGTGKKPLSIRILSPHWESRSAFIDPQEGPDQILWVARTRAAAVGLYRSPQSFGAHVVEKEESALLPGSLQDPLRSLQHLPGVHRAPMNAGWLLVRGSGPEDTLVHWKALPLPQLFHLGGIASILHPETLESVHYQPNPWVTRTGSLGGQVELTPAAAASRTRTRFGADLLNATAHTTAPLSPDKSVFAAARGSWIRSVLALSQGEDSARIAPQFADWSSGTTGPHSAFVILGFADSIDTPTADGEQILQIDLGGHQAMGFLEGKHGMHSWMISALAGWESEQLSDAGDALSLQQNQHVRLHLEDTVRHQNTRLEVGLDTAVGQGTVAVFPQKIARPWARAEGYLSLDIPSDVRVQIGLRNTHLWVQNQLSRLQWNPAIRLQWPFYRSLALRLQASRHHQTPSTYTLLADPEGAYIQLPRSDSFSAALGWKSDSAEFQLEGFAKSLAHLPLREEDGTLGQFSGQTWGIEAFGKAQFSNWSGSLSAAFARSHRREESDSDRFPDALDPGIQVAAVSIWRVPNDWFVSGRARYASGVPFQEDRPTAFDLLTQQNILLKPTINPTTGRLPDPYAFDLKIAKRRTFRTWRLEAYLDLQNLSNRRVPEPILTGFEEKPVFGFSLPFLPVFGVEGVFWPRGYFDSER